MFHVYTYAGAMNTKGVLNFPPVEPKHNVRVSGKKTVRIFRPLARGALYT